MVQNLCTHYSPSLLSLEHPFSPHEILTYHPFPAPSALAGSGVGSQLRNLGFGYRADYIQRTAKILVERHGSGKPLSPNESIEASEIWLRQLRKSSTTDAREELLKFVGVGRKVADCILLMSLDKVCAQ
jgi:N-glycosylase/DNA lyase